MRRRCSANRRSLDARRVGDPRFAIALGEKVRDGEGAVTSTRGACAPQTSFDHADFGATILCPGRFVMARRGGHFHTETHGLNAAAIDTSLNETFAHPAGAAIT